MTIGFYSYEILPQQYGPEHNAAWKNDKLEGPWSADTSFVYFVNQPGKKNHCE
jgi:hypothetical protein